MKANLRLDRNMRIIGKNEKGLETVFDTKPAVGGEDSAPTPMEIMLQSVAACSFMDTISILRKKEKLLMIFKLILKVKEPKSTLKYLKQLFLNIL